MDNPNYCFPQPTPAPRYPAGKRELRFGFAILFCNVFLWNSILYGGFNLGFALGTLAVIGCSVGYLFSCGFRFDRYSGSLIALSAVIAAGFARSADGFVKFVMLLFLLFAVNLSFCLVTGQHRRSPDGAVSVLDAPRAFFVLGFGSLGPGAIPYIAELTRDGDPDIAETAADFLNNRYCHVWDFRDWNDSAAAAESILDNFPSGG